MPKGKESSYNYGRKFMIGNREVMYRYVNKKRSTKTLVDARTKKPVKTTRTSSGQKLMRTGRKGSYRYDSM